MHGTLQKRATEAREIDRPNGREEDHVVSDVLEDIAKALWPKNTAANIASRIIGPKGKPVHPRTVERYFEGAREWSGDAIAVMVGEIMRRHGMRNVRVVKRQ